MEKEIKELVVILLHAIIEDGKAGINNAALEKDLDRLEFEYSKIDYAVKELINLNENEEGFSFYMLGRMLRRSNPNAKSMEYNIKEMISFYEDCLNDGLGAEDGYDEGRTTFDFTNDEINELAKLLEEM